MTDPEGNDGQIKLLKKGKDDVGGRLAKSGLST